MYTTYLLALIALGNALAHADTHVSFVESDQIVPELDLVGSDLESKTSPPGKAVLKYKAGGCATQAKVSRVVNGKLKKKKVLGKQFQNPTECLHAAAKHEACGDTVMWSPVYNKNWGCRCCAKGGEGTDAQKNKNWERWTLEKETGGTCSDKLLSTGEPWHDSGAPIYDCAWYAAKPASRCVDFGMSYKNEGMTGCQACCVCHPYCTPVVSWEYPGEGGNIPTSTSTYTASTYDAGSTYTASTYDAGSTYTASSACSTVCASCSSADCIIQGDRCHYNHAAEMCLPGKAPTSDVGSTYTASTYDAGSTYTASTSDVGSTYTASTYDAGSTYTAGGEGGEETEYKKLPKPHIPVPYCTGAMAACCTPAFSGKNVKMLSDFKTWTSSDGSTWSIQKKDGAEYSFQWRVQNDKQCGGHGEVKQDGKMHAKFEALRDIKVQVSMHGLAEADYEQLEIFVDDESIFKIVASDKPGVCAVSTCNMCPVQMKPKVFSFAKGIHDLKMEGTTTDGQFHNNVYFNVTLSAAVQVMMVEHEQSCDGSCQC